MALLFVSFLVALGLSGFLTWERRQGRRALADALARLRDLGEEIDLARIAPAPVPVVSNGFTKLHDATARIEVRPFLVPPNLQIIGPARALPGSWLKSWPGWRRESKDWSVAFAWATNHAEVLAEIRSALKAPVRQSDDDRWEGFVPEPAAHGTWKSAVIALRTSAAIALQRDQFAEAIVDLRGIRRIEQDLARQPLMIDHLTRISCVGVALAEAWDVLHARAWTEAQLGELQASLPSTNLVEGFVHALRGERALTYAVMRQAGGTNDWSHLQSLVSDGSPFAQLLPAAWRESLIPRDGILGRTVLAMQQHLVVPVWRFAWSDQALAHYLLSVQTLIDRQHEVARLRSPAPVTGIPDPAWHTGDGPLDRLRTLLTRQLLSGLQDGSHQALQVETERALLETGIALHRFRLRHQGYPERLEELVPEVLDRVPVDGLDGRPLRYRRNDDGTFMLWSVGEDGVDSGGDPTWDEDWSGSHFWWRARDAVWPQPAEPREIREWLRGKGARSERRGDSDEGAASSSSASPTPKP